MLYAYLERVHGGNGENIMSNRIENDSQPIGKVTRIDDFLPLPSQLVPKKDTVCVTLSLDRRSVDFFKGDTVKQHIPYPAHD